MQAVDEVNLVNLLRLFKLGLAPIAEELELDLAGLALGRPGRAAICRGQDIPIDRQRPAVLRIYKPY